MKQNENILSDCMYFTTGSLSRAVNELASQHFSKFDFSPSHAFLLVVISEKEKANIKDISLELNLAHSTVSRNLELHIKKGYLTKTTESRSTYIHLTEEGKKVAKEIKKAWENIHKDFIDAFDGDIDQYNKFNTQALSLFDKINSKIKLK